MTGPTAAFVLETSAIIAILKDEPERDAFVRAIRDAQRTVIGVTTAAEVEAVLRRGVTPPKVNSLFWPGLLSESYVELHAFDASMWPHAQYALTHFATGRSGLNFGDCFSYAMAKALHAPLLFKGSDFAKTDVRIHPASVA
jgi:ribonuclease VapC